MVTVEKIAEGVLSEIDFHYKHEGFDYYNKKFIFELIKNDISEMQYDPEFWYAQFLVPNKNYIIAASGELTSSGKYFIFELINVQQLNF
jgi:hypothetical protein